MFARRRDNARDNETVPISFIDWMKQFKPGQVVPFAGNRYQAVSTVGGGSPFYDNNSVVFACEANRLLLFSEARFQFQQMRKGRPGDLFGNESLAVLEEPWPGHSTGDLLLQAELDVFGAGNSYWTFDPASNGRYLIRLDPPKMKVLTTGVYDTISGQIFGEKLLAYAFVEQGRPPIIFEPQEIAHFKPYPDMANRFIGRSWVSACISDVTADAALTEHKRVAVQEGANLGYVVSLDKEIDKDSFDYFVTKFREDHERPENAGKTLFLGGGADVKVVGQTFENLAYNAVQGAGETRVAACSGVPPVIIGLSEGLSAATYSNYSQARRRLVDGTMRPLWRAFVSAFASLVPPPSGARLWYDDRDIAFLRDDIQEQAATLKDNASTIVALINGGFKPDAAIDSVSANDLARLTGQHSGFVSVQLQPIQFPGEEGAAPAAPAAPDQPALPPSNGNGSKVPAVTPAARAAWGRRVELAQRGVLRELMPPADSELLVDRDVIADARRAAAVIDVDPKGNGATGAVRDFIQGPDGKMAGSTPGGGKSGGKKDDAQPKEARAPGTVTKNGGMVVKGDKVVHIGDRVAINKPFEPTTFGNASKVSDKGIKVKVDEDGKVWVAPENIDKVGGPDMQAPFSGVGHLTPEDLKATVGVRGRVDTMIVNGKEVRTPDEASRLFTTLIAQGAFRDEDRDFIQGPDGKMMGSTGGGGKDKDDKPAAKSEPKTSPSSTSPSLDLGVENDKGVRVAVINDRERYVMLDRMDGISGGGHYIDNETGLHFFMKEGEYLPMEQVHEVLGAKLLENTELMHMDVRAASAPDATGNGAVVMLDAADDPNVDMLIGAGDFSDEAMNVSYEMDDFKANGPEATAQARAFAEDAVRMRTFDEVTNNTDRHSGNFLTVNSNADGMSHFYAIDHSLIDPTGEYQNEDGRMGRFFPFEPTDFDSTWTPADTENVRTTFLQDMQANIPALDAYVMSIHGDAAYAATDEVNQIKENIDRWLNTGEPPGLAEG